MNTLKIKDNSVFLTIEGNVLEFSKTSKNYNSFIVFNGDIFYLVS